MFYDKDYEDYIDDLINELEEEKPTIPLERVYVNTNQPPIDVVYNAEEDEARRSMLDKQDKNFASHYRKQRDMDDEFVHLNGHSTIKTVTLEEL